MTAPFPRTAMRAIPAILIAAFTALALHTVAIAQTAAKPAAPPAPAAPTPVPSDPNNRGGLGKDAMNASEFAQSTAPGPMHQRLAKCVGDWTTTSKFTPAKGADPISSAGAAKINSSLGGRFLQEANTGELMGQAYTGLRLTGYNNGSRRFESVWSYSMSTGLLTLTGTTDDEGASINWTGVFDDEQGQRQSLRIRTRFTDDDHFTITMYGEEPDTKDLAILETTYTRKK